MFVFVCVKFLLALVHLFILYYFGKEEWQLLTASISTQVRWFQHPFWGQDKLTLAPSFHPQIRACEPVF